MADRYTRLFTLPEELYLEGAPVVVAAGALLKDTQTGKVLSQLKFRSISDRVITAIKIAVTGYDMSKDPVCTAEHQYLDLQVKRDETWGSREAIALPDRSVRSYSVQVTAVYFSDGDCWLSPEADWTPLRERKDLEDVLWDKDLITQYRLETSKKSRFSPDRDRDLWLCACGEICHEDEKCPVCHQGYDELCRALELEYLRDKKNERIRKEMEQEAAVEAARAQQAKKLRRIARVAVPVFCAAVLCIAAAVILNGFNRRYSAAMALYDSGRYTEASSAFAALRGYKDSETMTDTALQAGAVESSYVRANNLMHSGNYQAAADAFEELGDYKDCPELLESARSALALSLIESGSEAEAAAILGDSEDTVKERAKELYYRRGLEYLNDGELEKALYCFSSADDYKDAAEKAGSFCERLVSEYHSLDEDYGKELTLTYEYDDQGRIGSVRLLSADGSVDVLREYKWNEDGSYSITSDGTEVMYDDHGICLGTNGSIEYSLEYSYYDDETLKSVTSWDLDRMVPLVIHLFDEHGNPTRITADNITTDIRNDYSDGRLTQQMWIKDDDSASFVYTFMYDSEGRLIRRTKVTGEGQPTYAEYTYCLVYSEAQK